MSSKPKSRLVIIVIILLGLATVCCVTTTPNSTSTPFFPRGGRDFPTGHAGYNAYNTLGNSVNNNAYPTLGNSVNGNPYNTLDYSVNNNAYVNMGDNANSNSHNNMGDSVNNNAYNTMGNSVNSNAYLNMGNSVNNNAYVNMGDNVNNNAYNTLDKNAGNNAYYEQESQRNTNEYTTRKGYGHHYQLYPGYGSHYYQPFHYQAPPLNCFNEHTMDNLFNIGANKLGTLGFFKAGFASLLTHIPYVLVKFFLKFALVKLGLFLLGAPLILPLLAMYLPYLANKFRPCCGDDDDDGYDDNNNATTRVRFQEGGDYEQVVGKAVKTLMDSERCYEKIACQLGTVNAVSEYNKPIMWILGSMVRAGTQEQRDRLKSFKEAYTKGVQDKTCGNDVYQCHLGKLVEGFK